MALDTGGNVRVDFVWGNLPMQPDDERGLNTLNPALDNHIIAATQYNGFPDYTPETPFLDTVANVTVPDVVGLTQVAATAALVAAGLVVGNVSTTVVGATVENDGLVKSQLPVDATVVNEGDAVDITLYDYVAP